MIAEEARRLADEAKAREGVAAAKRTRSDEAELKARTEAAQKAAEDYLPTALQIIRDAATRGGRYVSITSDATPPSFSGSPSEALAGLLRDLGFDADAWYGSYTDVFVDWR